MNNISTQNPLFQPIPYKDQVYFTSHYFHSQYKINAGEKYSKLKHFNELIRSIEAYPKYIEIGDIVEIKSKKDILPEAENLDLAYKSNNYANLMLINATAQIALTHHLDDEISKSISVAVNTQAATQQKIDMRYIAQTAKAALSLAKLFGLEGNQALLGANTATKRITGCAPLELLERQLIAEAKEKTITPTDIGLQLGNISAQKVNQLLQDRGYQTGYRDLHDKPQWQPTEKGKPFGEMIDTDKKHGSGAPIKQWRWYLSIVEQLKSLEAVA